MAEFNHNDLLIIKKTCPYKNNLRSLNCWTKSIFQSCYYQYFCRKEGSDKSSMISYISIRVDLVEGGDQEPGGGEHVPHQVQVGEGGQQGTNSMIL